MKRGVKKMELKQATAFKLDGRPIYCGRYGSGHINQTYLLVDETAREYILQKINQNVFKRPDLLMQNIVAVTNHLRQKTGSHREVLTLVPTLDGKDWLVDEDGEYWRLYEFVTDIISLDKAESPDDLRESGLAFGRFQRQLADFPAHTLSETIPRFHDTPNRYTALKDAITADRHGRVKEVGPEIEFALAREEFASVLMVLQAKDELPLRVTHNDTKLNNVLFDRKTRKALCVIDLDTVMPGLAANDFGDTIRFGATSAAEDERDLSKVSFVLPLYEAFAEGFLAACGESLTPCEREHLPHGAKMMTLECGVRFLTDYLSGDTYFRTSREGQNLDRCRTQFKLVQDMEREFEKMRRAIG
jgi:Ser/Thr protein kinase RdoA (MazF antagonist)